jgi:hypothetical protein
MIPRLIPRWLGNADHILAIIGSSGADRSQERGRDRAITADLRSGPIPPDRRAVQSDTAIDLTICGTQGDNRQRIAD